MTLAQLNARLALGVNRTDLDDSAGIYTSILNDAQRDICRRRSWQWMKTRATLTLLAGATTVALPSNFKEFTGANSPVALVIDGVAKPLEVWTPEKHQRRTGTVLSSEIAVHLDDSVTPKVLDFIYALDAGADTSIKVAYYAYLTALAGAGDTNTLTQDHPDMLLNKAKALAFAAVNDPAAGDFETLFEVQFRRASASDAYAQVTGTTLRM